LNGFSETVQDITDKYIATVAMQPALNESLNESVPPFMTAFGSIGCTYWRKLFFFRIRPEIKYVEIFITRFLK
jgi:hypothetical protein